MISAAAVEADEEFAEKPIHVEEEPKGSTSSKHRYNIPLTDSPLTAAIETRSLVEGDRTKSLEANLEYRLAQLERLPVPHSFASPVTTCLRCVFFDYYL